MDAPRPRVKVGVLVPLQSNLEVDASVSSIQIFEGENILGRDILTLSDKRISRKHATLHASVDGLVELIVEGPNPIILKSGDQRMKLCTHNSALIVPGDIVEFIPGCHLFKYDAVYSRDSVLGENSSLSSIGKRSSYAKLSSGKRSKQSIDVEACAIYMQEEKKCVISQTSLICGAGAESSKFYDSLRGVETTRPIDVRLSSNPMSFRLMKVQGLPSWANSSSVSISDVIKGSVQFAILSNYMVDIDWLLSECPSLRLIPHVLVVHGESGIIVDHLKKKIPVNWILHKPPLPISYGTHHSKAMLLVYSNGVRVIVHTANLIYVDWNNKTQGLWMQDFPLKDSNNLSNVSPFESDLVDYISSLKWPELCVNLPNIGNVKINPAFFKNFDYSGATVRLIASIPGYHMGLNLKKWGHMKVRSVLEDWIFDKEFCKSPLVYQFSSLGSLDQRWLDEFTSSMSAGRSTDKLPLGLGNPSIIWPTVEDVRCSLEGYAAGNAIPSPQKNVEKEFLKNYWARWKANHSGRCRAMPHIKTYTRFNGQSIGWFLLTSANLSKAAWGALQKSNTQLMIRSYELGVLFLPSSTLASSFSCTENVDTKQVKDPQRRTKFATLCSEVIDDPNPATEIVCLPVPYELPPLRYNSEDVPWSWDRRYTKKDVHGLVWPREVHFYADEDG